MAGPIADGLERLRLTGLPTPAAISPASTAAMTQYRAAEFLLKPPFAINFSFKFFPFMLRIYDASMSFYDTSAFSPR